MRLRTGLLAAALALTCGVAWAKTGPFGVGVPENGGGFGSGPFGQAMLWIAGEQARFYRSLTGAVRTLDSEGAALPTLVGLSFLYGVFHAAGPGHGKVVLTSYLLANEATLKRGVILAFAAGMVQATVVATLVLFLALTLRVNSIQLIEVGRVIELVSYLVVALLGAWLLWSKLRLFFQRTAANEVHGPDCLCGGHAHMPHPRVIQGSWKAGLAVVLAIGARPCTGAIAVLAFAISQGLTIAGLLSVYVIAVGTAITVSALAALAVYAKRSALRLAGMQWNRGLEVFGAALVFVFGLTLFVGALASG